MAKDKFLQLLLTDACFIIVCNLQKIEENQVFKNKQSSVVSIFSDLNIFIITNHIIFNKTFVE